MNRSNAEQIIVGHKASKKLFSDAILYLLQRSENHGDGAAGALAEELLASAGPEDVSSATFLRYLERSALVTGASRSFKARVAEMHDKHQLGSHLPSWYLDDKLTGYRFSDAIGVRHPEVLGAASRWNDLELRPGVAVKIASGSSSKGCYLIYNESSIWSVHDGLPLGSYEELTSHAQAFLKASGRGTESDRWVVEELVMRDWERNTPARDIKLFCFYGEVALVREIERVPQLRSAHWDAFGYRADPLLKSEPPLRHSSFSQEAMDLASRISSHVPAPFIRIDLLEGAGGLYLGEFTPWPGTFARKTPQWDWVLGEAWARADARLMEGLLNGKRFDAFMRTTAYGSGATADYPS